MKIAHVKSYYIHTLCINNIHNRLLFGFFVIIVFIYEIIYSTISRNIGNYNLN